MRISVKAVEIMPEEPLLWFLRGNGQFRRSIRPQTRPNGEAFNRLKTICNTKKPKLCDKYLTEDKNSSLMF